MLGAPKKRPPQICVPSTARGRANATKTTLPPGKRPGFCCEGPYHKAPPPTILPGPPSILEVGESCSHNMHVPETPAPRPRRPPPPPPGAPRCQKIPEMGELGHSAPGRPRQEAPFHVLCEAASGRVAGCVRAQGRTLGAGWGVCRRRRAHTAPAGEGVPYVCPPLPRSGGHRARLRPPPLVRALRCPHTLLCARARAPASHEVKHPPFPPFRLFRGKGGKGETRCARAFTRGVVMFTRGARRTL